MVCSYSYKSVYCFSFLKKLFLLTDTYHRPSAQCTHCFKSIFLENKQQGPQKPRENKSKLNAILKCLLKPICIRSRRSKKKTISVPEKCSCTTVSHATLNQSSDSMTFIDLPWIVPSKYHKNSNGKSIYNHLQR